MKDVEEIVELSENDDDDDCILESVIYEEAKLNKTVNDDQHPLLTEFIETCLKLENSEEMYRVINRTLLKNYKETDISFKKSQVLNKALRSAINRVKAEPSLKYTHIKDLCEIFKSSNAKKRVQLITLSNNTKGKKLPSLSLKRRSENARNSKKQKIDIIDLDLSEDVTNSLAEASEQNVIHVGEQENNELSSPSKYTDENKLLIPHIELQYNEILHSSCNEEISKIEEEIAYCKRAIAELDEKEVCVDTRYSPYVKSELFKARILSLYKKLCNLTGEVPVRPSTVRLKVRDGHPAGPVRRLEKFINKNVGNDGNPIFPSFRDVVKCVLKSNESDNLGWNKQQIMKEASALFTHCGRALQKRRQKREWRDLLSKVKVEVGDDPADSDPALLARLEANRRDAVKKEKAILERFTRMQNMPPKSDNAVCSQVRDDDESSNSLITSSSDESENEQLLNYGLGQKTTTNNITVGNTDDETCDMPMIKVKTEPELKLNQFLDELGDNYTTTTEIGDPFVIIEISDSSSEDSV